MNVLLDGQPLFPPLTGIGNYTRELYNNLNGHYGVNVDLWFNQISNNKHVSLGIESSKLINNKYPYKVIRRLMGPNFFHDFPIANGYDIFHGTNFLLFNTPKTTKNILTIHDLAFLYYPEVTDDKTYRHHKLWLPYSIERADHIITVSENTKRDVIELYGVSEKDITVTYLGYNENLRSFNTMENKELINFRQALPPNYFLFVGTIEPRKNLLTLIRILCKLKQETNIQHKLVLVGKKGWKSEDIYNEVHKNKLENDVIFLGFIDNDELTLLYKNADLFLFPSIYEGFGLPVVEAMKLGTPVVCSKSSCLPEVVDQAGILVDPFDEDKWVEEILKLLNDENRYTFYRQEGLRRAKYFTWGSTAIKTKQLYERILR